MKLVPRAALVLTVALSVGTAGAQTTPPQTQTTHDAGSMGSMPMQHHTGMHPMTGMREQQGMGGMMHGAGHPAAMPTESGQGAFGAAQEIVRMLQADPTTNWSKVDIDALRQHLIDMDEVTVHANVQKEPMDKGLRILVTGSGRTLEAIQRMIPAHVQDINGLYGWTVQAKALPNGEEMTVTGDTSADVQQIRGLGFLGLMVLGTHQMHHLAMAKGEMMHMH